MQNAHETKEGVDSGRDGAGQSVELKLGRQKIGGLIDGLVRERFVRSETAADYRKAADATVKVEHMDEYYKWIEKGTDAAREKFKDMMGRMDRGVQQGIMTEKDRAFLVDHLILAPDHDFIGPKEMEKIDRLLKEKMERMEVDRKGYDEIAQHRLARNTGFLKTGKHAKFAVPPAAGFLGMTVPKRREWLEEAKAVLPRAEAYAAESAREEGVELTRSYTQKLQNAREQGWIGKAVMEKFLDGFRHIDAEEKKHWNDEKVFDEEMARYRKQQKEIRDTFRDFPEALESMNALRETCGYTELFIRFGERRESESARLETDYRAGLDAAVERGDIGEHSRDSFLNAADGFLNQDLHGRLRYVKEWGGQLARYRELEAAIQRLPEKERAVFEDNADVWGYTEKKSEYEKIMAPHRAGKTGAEHALENLENRSVREGIEKARDLLDAEQAKALIQTLRDKEKDEGVEATSYQSNIARARLQQKKETLKAPVAEEEEATAEDLAFQSRIMQARQKNQTDMQAGAVLENLQGDSEKEEGPEVKIITSTDRSFEKVSFEGAEEIRSVTRVDLASKEGMQQYLHGERQAGDRVSFTLQNDHQVVELSRKEDRVLKAVLEEKVRPT